MRSTRRVLVAGVIAPLALIAVAACGPNEDKSGPSGSASVTAAPTATGAAPATKAPAGAAPATSAADKGAKPLTQDQLIKTLLTVKDLQADDKRSYLGAPRKEHKITADKPACQPLLDLADAGNAATPPTAAATGEYHGTNGREYTLIELSQFGAGQAVKALATAQAALASCVTFNGSSPGRPNVKIEVGKPDMAPRDDFLAFQAQFSADDCDNAKCEIRSYTFVRTGDVLTLVSKSALVNPGMPEQETIKKQVDKVRAAQQG